MPCSIANTFLIPNPGKIALFDGCETKMAEYLLLNATTRQPPLFLVSKQKLKFQQKLDFKIQAIILRLYSIVYPEHNSYLKPS